MKKSKKIKETLQNFPKNFYRNNKKFIWKMVIIIAVGNMALFVKNYQRQRAYVEAFPMGMEVTSFDEYMKTQKDVPSDIEGLSVYDKYTMGLQRQDGSDSDYDGLTDKEEIEIYGTDPLKASSAGDLYTDAYKVQNGLDPYTYKEYTEEIAFPYLECEEVQLTASSPIDFNAVVTDCTFAYDLSSFEVGRVYKGYDLYNYGGIVKINVHDQLTENDINDFEIYITNGPFVIPGENSFKKCSYKLEGDNATLDYEFEHGSEYLIFLTEKQGFKIKSFINGIFNQDDAAVSTNIETTDSGKVLISGSPWGVLFGGKIKIYYTECIKEENTEKLKLEAENLAMEMFGGNLEDKKLVLESANKIDDKENLYNKFFKLFRYPGKGADVAWYEFFFKYGIFCYDTYENTYELADGSDTTKEEHQAMGTGFDKYEDELPFQNFRSYIGTGGNCAGITHLTSYLYNTGSFPSSGTYNCSINGTYEQIQWDLSTDNENATLSNPGLIDYKDIEFVTEHSENGDYLSVNLTEGEQEFVNMIGCYWTEANDRINMNAYEKTTGEYYDASLLNRMTDLLDQGKILDVYLYMRGGGAHAVNIYGYEYIAANSVLFTVYDNNIPQDCKDGYMINADANGNCYLQVTIRKDEGGNDILEYLYMPLQGSKDYIASSMKNLMKSNAMVVMDENWNVLN